MTGSVRATAQREVHASLEEPIQNRFGKVAIMHDVPHGRKRFIGGEQHWPPLEITLVDDAIEDVRRIGRVREIPQLINYEDVRVQVGLEYYGAVGPATRFEPAYEQHHQIFATFQTELGHRWEIGGGIGRGLTRESDRTVLTTKLEYTFGP